MFKNGEVICFLGDSITANGSWIAEVYQTIGKHTDIKCYNCGVSGSTARLADDYLYGVCLMKNPTKVVVMFGVNDIDRWALSSKYAGEEQPRSIIERAIKRYRNNMESIIRKIREFGAEVILCTAMPYDEYSELEAENYRCDYALEECATIVKELAAKYSCPVVDFRARILPLIASMAPIGADRVHPTPKGYHMMAQIFLNEIGQIAECDFDTPFVLEGWNEKRFAVEQKIKLLDFVDYVIMYKLTTEEERPDVFEKAQKCHELYEKEGDKNGYTATCYKTYFAYSGRREDLYNELTRYTVFPRKAENI